MKIEQFPFYQRNVEAKVRLLCFPFAGGNAAVFKEWGKHLPKWIEVCAYEPPARATRFGDPPKGSMIEIVADVREGLVKLEPMKTALFGHSMGGRIAFAVAKECERELEVIHMFQSASRPPIVPPRIRSTSPRDELMKELRRLGGTPKEILDDSEMMDLFIPIMRADFAVVETALPADVVSIPITAIAGETDTEATPAFVREWEKVAGNGFRYVLLPAPHFFLDSHRDSVLREVEETLRAN